MPAYSGLWNGVYATPHTVLAGTVEMTNVLKELGRAYGQRPYSRGAMQATIKALVGAAPGGTATEQHKRVTGLGLVAGPAGGGTVAIQTHTAINRATTAADVTTVTRGLDYKSRPTTYVPDLGGNGGGGKLGS